MKQRLIHLDEFPDKPFARKASVILVEDGKICDGCDTSNLKCVSIRTIGSSVTILCQDCIEGILDSFDEAILRNRKIDNVLN